jgi:hypothetical protein
MEFSEIKDTPKLISGVIKTPASKSVAVDGIASNDACEKSQRRLQSM